MGWGTTYVNTPLLELATLDARQLVSLGLLHISVSVKSVSRVVGVGY
jgi:hypothetical protein